jgi:hypothetical protein
MGAIEVTAFLSDLAIRRNVAASTQNQALHAILFLHRNVLQIKLLNRSSLRTRAPPSCARGRSAARSEASYPQGRDHKARQRAYAATFIRHAPTCSIAADAAS